MNDKLKLQKMKTVNDFLEQMKTKCQAKAKEMATIELSIHDDANHQSELKQYFGFTDASLVKRKIQLQKDAA